MLELRGLAFVSLLLMLHGAAWAESQAVKVDESKLPEWIRRQATSPYKMIIESMPVRAKPVAKADAAPAKPVKAVAAKPSTPDAAPALASKPAPAALAAQAPPRLAADTASASSPNASTAIESARVDAPSATPIPATLADSPSADTAPTTTLALANPASPRAPEPSTETLEELKLLTRVDPQLTQRLQSSLKGPARVVVAFTVNRDGSVSGAAISSSSNNALNRTTLAAVKDWRYEPIHEPREHMVAFTFLDE